MMLQYTALELLSVHSTLQKVILGKPHEHIGYATIRCPLLTIDGPQLTNSYSATVALQAVVQEVDDVTVRR